MQFTFSIKQSVSQSWKLFKSQWQFLVGSIVVIIVITGIINFAISFVELPVLQILLNFASIIIAVLLNIALLGVFLTAAKQQKLDKEVFWRYSNRFVDFFIASILYNIIVGIGFILLIIPGIYWALKYHFYKFAIIEDEDCGIIESFKRSARATKGVKWKLVGLWFVFLGIFILGILALGIGVLAAMPVIGVATAIVYLSLRKNAVNSASTTASEQVTTPSEQKA